MYFMFAARYMHDCVGVTSGQTHQYACVHADKHGFNGRIFRDNTFRKIFYLLFFQFIFLFLNIFVLPKCNREEIFKIKRNF